MSADFIHRRALGLELFRQLARELVDGQLTVAAVVVDGEASLRVWLGACQDATEAGQDAPPTPT